ncbi:Serine/threonine-protein kinase DCLK1 [Takifugu flavidus]|uniref:Serine/threonine-protein kinase DCLK1 n=1 Tax=Takifugu flavidus TaxID=433684 RepID=A0A5C6P8W3_9TELE|nr:Serine/threonine-protein kinase DCLK1 [Takifugu flavidus]
MNEREEREISIWEERAFLQMRRGSQGSSTSLSSSKVSSSVEDGDGAVNEGRLSALQPSCGEVPAVPPYISERYTGGRTLGDGNFAVEHMIQNEVAILRRVKHPNIVLLIEEVDTYNELYLVMELTVEEYGGAQRRKLDPTRLEYRRGHYRA